MTRGYLESCVWAGSRSGIPGWRIMFQYDVAIIEDLKRMVPHTAREWDKQSGTWWVSKDFEYELAAVFPNFMAFKSQMRMP